MPFNVNISNTDFKRIDWDGVFNHLSSTSINHVTDFYSFVPIVRRQITCKVDDWLKSSEIVYSRSLRDMAFREYLRDRTPENWNIYCLYRNKANSVLRKY